MTSVSVVLCTYQGERYLPEQLATIAAQTRPPDELVACDDGSTDATVELLHEFGAEVPYPVTVHESPGGRVGPAANFARAVHEASGDVVVLCDQDDAWYPQRIERAVALLDASPAAVAVFGDADLIDDSGRPTGQTLWEALGVAGDRAGAFLCGEPAERVALLVEGNLVTGATLTFRAEHRRHLLPVPSGWLHDHWFAVVLSAVGEVVMSDERLLRYRIHPAQHTGLGAAARGPRTSSGRVGELWRRATKDERAAFAGQAHALTEALDRLVALECVDPPVLASIEERRDHLSVRAEMTPGLRRYPAVARELRGGRYQRHSGGALGALKDGLLLERWRPR